MNRIQIEFQYKEFLHRFRIQPREFVLGAGGACVMHGIRDNTDDMDMGLQLALYSQMLRSNKYHTDEFRGTTIIHYNNFIDLHPIEEGETIMISGVCCYTAERLLMQKLTLNRPKDQDDIAALRKLLRKSK